MVMDPSDLPKPECITQPKTQIRPVISEPAITETPHIRTQPAGFVCDSMVMDPSDLEKSERITQPKTQIRPVISKPAITETPHIRTQPAGSVCDSMVMDPSDLAKSERITQPKTQSYSNIIVDSENTWYNPRLCDYTGLYYCTSCHWNNSVVVPARVAHNWDLESYYVSRATYQFLRFTRNRPLITPDTRIYGFVKELAEIKRLREEFSLMKSYLVRCRDAKEEKQLMWKQFGTRSHLLEPSGVLSLRDLLELQSGKLLTHMRNIASKFTEHITKICKICSGQGYICELCEEKNDVLYPFNSNVYTCSTCSWVYHKPCWYRSPSCTKCERNRRKLLELDGGAETSGT